MDITCTHGNTRWVGDMPIANKDTGIFEGRFDVNVCQDCGDYLEKVPVGTKE